MTIVKAKKYGWIPDIPDWRDFKFSSSLVQDIKLPPYVNLQPKMPPVYQQNSLGCCTSCGVTGAMQYNFIKQGVTSIFLSKLFVYYNTRVIENTINEDSGAQIRNAVKSASIYGAPDEKYWPYDINKFKQKPPKSAYKDARTNIADSYFRINQNLYELKSCIYQGFPVIFGFAVYEGFESKEVASTGTLYMPKKSEKFLGGHCTNLIGFNDNIKRFIVRNSWGDKWGQNGYFTMSYDYVTNPGLADDFWTIRHTT